MHQDDAIEPFQAEHPECFPGFILFCEVTNENANTQAFVLCSLHDQSRRPWRIAHDEENSERNKMVSSGDLTG
jgi:hypothetical protein